MAIAFIRIDEHPAAVPFYKNFAPEEPISPSGVMKLKTFHKIKDMTAYRLLKTIANKAKKNSEVLIVTHGTDRGLVLPLTNSNTVLLERESIRVFLDKSQSRADKLAKLQVNEKQLKLLEEAVKKVKKLALQRVEFRACNVGQNVKTLEALRDFFGARIAGGPDLQDAYVALPKPYTGKTDPWWSNNSKANVETMSKGGRVGYILLDVKPTSFRFQWAADTTEAQKEWVRKHFPRGKSVARPVAIHGMLDGTTKLIFPGDSNYLPHLQST